MLTIIVPFQGLRLDRDLPEDFLQRVQDTFGEFYGNYNEGVCNPHIKLTYHGYNSSLHDGHFDEYQALTKEGELWMLLNAPPTAKIIRTPEETP